MTMSTKVGIRELVRDTSILDKYDYIEIEDKKTHKSKGIFVSEKYAKDIQEFLEKTITLEKKKKLDRFLKYAGTCEVHERFNNLTSSQIKQKIAEEKYGY